MTDALDRIIAAGKIVHRQYGYGVLLTRSGSPANPWVAHLVCQNKAIRSTWNEYSSPEEAVAELDRLLAVEVRKVEMGGS